MDHSDRDRSADEKAQRDAALDEALEETFPTSDTIQLTARTEDEPAAKPAERT
ncbi:hypothetical protein [Sphingobium yanoikuyae]|uniref:hypothetical protein n=1 Tax=Sphingobium yanoikuyae TaxID=13690 RepID=UPI0015581EF6|nr:hypothetical protein [Sphingobium yanoikuyae]